MKTQLHAILLIALILSLSGCANKPIVATGPRFIQTTTPEINGVLYIYRTYDQFDESVRDVYLNDQKILILPNSGYTTITLEPGNYTIHSEINGKRKKEPTLDFEIKPNSSNYIRLHILSNNNMGNMSVYSIGGILTPTWDNTLNTMKTWVFQERNDPPPPIKGCRFVHLENGLSVIPK